MNGVIDILWDIIWPTDGKGEASVGSISRLLSSCDLHVGLGVGKRPGPVVEGDF